MLSLIIITALVARGKLVLFDVCDTRAAETITEKQAIKLSPLTKTEEKQMEGHPNFKKWYPKGSLLSGHAHEVLKCYLNEHYYPYFRL